MHQAHETNTVIEIQYIPPSIENKRAGDYGTVDFYQWDFGLCL